MLALVLTVPASEVELASDALWALGVVAVEERSPPGAAPGTLDHFVELWTSLGDDPDTVTRAAEGFPDRWRWHIVDIDESVADTWRAHAVASWVSPELVVVPSWLPADAVRSPHATQIRIDPGAAFGLGDHPTTILSLRALGGLIREGATVLDVGCGSGVLSVTAAVLGATYVEAVDISPAAVDATIANAERNGVSARVRASNRTLASVTDEFDIVLANILAPVLVDLAPDLARVTSRSGVLVLSGVLDGAYGHVLDALSPMQVVDRMSREGWSVVVLRH
jgi:ribosomal protein L11 methyltransferase